MDGTTLSQMAKHALAEIKFVTVCEFPTHTRLCLLGPCTWRDGALQTLEPVRFALALGCCYFSCLTQC